MSDLIKAEDENKAIAMEGEADEAKRDAPRKKHLRSLMDMAMPLDAEPENTDSNEEDTGEELMTVEESTHHEQPVEKSPDEPETVEDLKKGLKDYLKSMFRRK